jgi:hypothetical protein
VKIPNFFIAGAPKSGTTSLHAYLEQHPQIYMSPLKETFYFAPEVRAENFTLTERERIRREAHDLEEYLRGDLRARRFGAVISNWDDYLRLFRFARDEIAIGEATPHYLWSQTAAHNIAAQIPHAKIIIVLRNPVERAFSNYLHLLRVGATRRSFREQVEANLRCTEQLIGLDWPFLELGHYAQQIERYFKEFPREQIHISLYEELQGDPGRLLAELLGFLGVERGFRIDVSQRHNESQVPRSVPAYLLQRWPLLRKVARLTPRAVRSRARPLLLRSRASVTMDPADRAFLTDYYRDEIRALARLLNRDLSAWLR